MNRRKRKSNEITGIFKTFKSSLLSKLLGFQDVNYFFAVGVNVICIEANCSFGLIFYFLDSRKSR